MARAVFQMVQDHTPTSEISSTKIKRGQDRISHQKSPYLNFKFWKDKKMKITSLLLLITYIKDLQDKCD
jgi:hypothetical protein